MPLMKFFPSSDRSAFAEAEDVIWVTDIGTIIGIQESAIGIAGFDPDNNAPAAPSAKLPITEATTSLVGRPGEASQNKKSA
jgi:hypothetical protein